MTELSSRQPGETPRSELPPGAIPAAGSAHATFLGARLAETGLWGRETLADIIANHARERPRSTAFRQEDSEMSWQEYHEASDRLAAVFIASGMEPGARLGVFLPDGVTVHAVFVAAEKAGLILVGIGPRAGYQEVRHLLAATEARAIVTLETHRGEPMSVLVRDLKQDGLNLKHHFVVGTDPFGPVRLDGINVSENISHVDLDRIKDRKIEVGDLWLLNSTSGTTGMPKCVMHTQNRWFFYHTLALDAGGFTQDDIFVSLIPAPYGFAQWTAHFTPTILGCPTVVMQRFTPDGALQMMERERATVLCCVSTQFIMLLNSPSFVDYDLSSLRCMFTGGEAVPLERSEEFEDKTGAKVLQFYGTNETGTLSYTRHYDSKERRLQTSGKIVDTMNVRLYDDAGTDITATKGPGQAGCSGPAACLGYYADPSANEALFTADGSMLTGDVCTIDGEGYLHIVGRKSDFIIRGGKNISAAAVEEQVRTHPSVAMTAAVAVPDEVYGERVCVYVVLRDGASLDLPSLVSHLGTRGVSKEIWPEMMEIVADLPRASGGKISKAKLREDIRKRVAASQTRSERQT